MYKIYINGTPLFLTSSKDSDSIILEGNDYIKNRYFYKKKSLFGRMSEEKKELTGKFQAPNRLTSMDFQIQQNNLSKKKIKK